MVPLAAMTEGVKAGGRGVQIDDGDFGFACGFCGRKGEKYARTIVVVHSFDFAIQGCKQYMCTDSPHTFLI